MLRQIERGVQNGPIKKNEANNYFIFLKNCFGFKNLLQRVDLMYQLTKYPYS